MNDNAQSARSVHDHFAELFAFVWMVVSAMQLANWDNRAFWGGDKPWPLFVFQLSFTLSGSFNSTMEIILHDACSTTPGQCYGVFGSIRHHRIGTRRICLYDRPAKARAGAE